MSVKPEFIVKLKGTVYQYWRHLRTGEDWAVRIEAGKVTSSVGALFPHEVFAGNEDNFNFDDPDAVEGGLWTEEHQDEYRLIEHADA